MRIANAEKLQCNPNTTRDFLFIFAYANVIWIWILQTIYVLKRYLRISLSNEIWPYMNYKELGAFLDSFLTGPLEPTNDQLPTSVASYLSWLERRTGIARSRAQTPLKSWIFQASLRNCKNCAHNCEDHSFTCFLTLSLKVNNRRNKDYRSA